jgi:hypothetical protein
LAPAGSALRGGAALEHVIAANRIDRQPADLLTALEAAARSDAPIDGLVSAAIALHQGDGQAPGVLRRAVAGNGAPRRADHHADARFAHLWSEVIQ